MEIIIYQVDAFTDKPFGGNPAAVIPDASKLSEDDMQNIAREMNLSETAFVIPKNNEEYKVRFFTPECEVDLCGHATIAAFYTLGHKGYINNSTNDNIKRVYQETKAGRLPVDIYYEDNNVKGVMMHQSKPKFLGDYEDVERLSMALNIPRKDIGLENLKIKPSLVSTGLLDIIVPVKDKKTLDNLKVNYDMVREISKEVKAGGLHVFTIDGKEVYCRNFAPALGINEESATGTANGALLAYLNENHIINNNNIVVNQGESLNRLSKIYCEIIKEDNTSRIKVGGDAVIVMEGVINI